MIILALSITAVILISRRNKSRNVKPLYVPASGITKETPRETDKERLARERMEARERKAKAEREQAEIDIAHYTKAVAMYKEMRKNLVAEKENIAKQLDDLHTLASLADNPVAYMETYSRLDMPKEEKLNNRFNTICKRLIQLDNAIYSAEKKLNKARQIAQN